MAAVSIQEYQKALTSLKESVAAHKSQKDAKIKEMLRDSVIQRFEFCFELAWKVAVKTLGISTNAPKMGIREMAQAKLINNFELWFDFLEARIKSSHSYDEKIANEILLQIEKFITQAESLLSALNSK